MKLFWAPQTRAQRGIWMLEEAGVDFEYEEHPGGHEWPYWVEHLRDTLKFFARQMD